MAMINGIQAPPTPYFPVTNNTSSSPPPVIRERQEISAGWPVFQPFRKEGGRRYHRYREKSPLSHLQEHPYKTFNFLHHQTHNFTVKSRLFTVKRVLAYSESRYWRQIHPFRFSFLLWETHSHSGTLGTVRDHVLTS